MAGLVLALNAGSSNLKAALFDTDCDEPTPVARTQIDGGVGQAAAVSAALAWVERSSGGRALAAAGHRIVHGGADFHAPQRLTPEVMAALEALTPLAPLHQPEGLAAMRALASERPQLPQVACFDTAFHWTQPDAAQRLALPRALHDRGVRRYGFHGLSYEHLARRLCVIDPELAQGRVVAAHLGSGASLCAIQQGCSVETTMGFSPLDGLVMSTRPGQLDPGVVLYLLQHEGLGPSEVEDLLYRRSGLLGVSGLSGDMRTLLASDTEGAWQAVELFVHRTVMLAGGLAAAMGGIDGVVFTAGVGEHSPDIRARLCERLAWLGAKLDAEANQGSGERRLDAPGARLRIWVVPADEEATIVRHTLEVLGSG